MINSGSSKASGDTREELKEWNMNRLRFIYIEIESKGADDVTYSNRLNAKDGVILSYENIKEQDKNPKGYRLWPSEAIQHSFLLAAEEEDVDPSSLQLIFRYCLVNFQILLPVSSHVAPNISHLTSSLFSFLFFLHVLSSSPPLNYNLLSASSGLFIFCHLSSKQCVH